MTAPALDLQRVFLLLKARFGPQRWWPAETPFEVVVGAILTQNTSWSNVERAIANLKVAGALAPAMICRLAINELEQLIRPTGFFRQKAVRLHHLAKILVDRYGGDVAQLCAGPLDQARGRLLALPGIGPETADAILLYAGQRPSFVVDAYTRRIFTRLGMLSSSEGYQSIRARFLIALPQDVPLFNEYHALIVTLAKGHCRKQRPECATCPLQQVCRFASQNR
jgi:endonuclease-3 related protein